MAQPNAAAEMAAVVDALAYVERSRLKGDVVTALREFNTLTPNRKELLWVRNEQFNEATLLTLNGTLPMNYKGATYHIPVELFFPLPYPREPPICYVRPTRDMVIPKDHAIVNSEGIVNIAYLQHWNPGTHSLQVLLALMASEFGEKPPVRSRPSGAAAQHLGQGSRANVVQVNASRGMNGARPPPSYGSVVVGPGGGAQAERPRSPALTGPEAVKRDAKHKVQEAVQSCFLRVRTQLDDEFRRQTLLEKQLQAVDAAEAELTKKHEALQQAVHAADQAEKFLRTHLEQKAAEGAGDELKAEDHLALSGLHAEQLLREVSMAQAAEDALYFMDRALGQGTVSLEVFLREVRRISRRQFLHRALVQKIQRLQEGLTENGPDAYDRSGSVSPSPGVAAPPSYSALMRRV